jgi:hypothetical protein
MNHIWVAPVIAAPPESPGSGHSKDGGVVDDVGFVA